MGKFLKYAGYIYRHKRFVGEECFRRGLIWRGIIHDYDKLFPSRWKAYADFFYTPNPSKEISEAFRISWRRHWQMNDHHHQWWVSIHDDGEVRPHEMSEIARTEMLCDWIGAHKAIGGKSLLEWYTGREESIILHPKTKRWIKQQLITLEKENGRKGTKS